MSPTAASGVSLAALWRLLSLGFAAPTAETLAEVEVLADGLVEAGAGEEVQEVLEHSRATDPGELSAQYSRLFRGTVLVSPYEGSYELDPIRQGRQMADVAAFYRAFGAEVHGPAAERPDFAGCELEFLAFLELRRLAATEADEDGIDVLEGIRTSFLADHAGRWLPTFFRSVAAESGERPFYRALAVLGLRVLEDELARQGIEPARLPRRRPRSSVEGDVVECGSGSTASAGTL